MGIALAVDLCISADQLFKGDSNSLDGFKQLALMHKHSQLSSPACCSVARDEVLGAGLLTLTAMLSASSRLPPAVRTRASMQSTQHVRPDTMDRALRSNALPAVITQDVLTLSSDKQLACFHLPNSIAAASRVCITLGHNMSQNEPGQTIRCDGL